MRAKYFASLLLILVTALCLLSGYMNSSLAGAQAATLLKGQAKGTLQILPKSVSKQMHPSITRAGAWSAIPTTTSFYEATTDAHTMYAQGCQAARGVAGLLILDWGQPVYLGNGSYGTYNFGGHAASDTAIFHAVANFVLGVWSCRTSATNIAVAIGESNYYSGNAIPLTQAAWYADGLQWGNLVNNVASFVANNHYSNIGIYGAGDLETGWNTFALTSSMVNGYNNASSHIYFDFGDDAPGNWTNAQVWYVAYGARDNLPLPEIYFNADAIYDWEALNIWACTHAGGPMYIRGVMATVIGNTPAQAWTAMYNAESGNSCTAKTSSWLTFSTYIR